MAKIGGKSKHDVAATRQQLNVGTSGGGGGGGHS